MFSTCRVLGGRDISCQCSNRLSVGHPSNRGSQGNGDDCTPLFSTEVKNEWRNISIVPYTFMTYTGKSLP